MGKTALVTGASSGIGKAVAFELAALGADIALVSRRPKPLEELKQLLQKQGVSVLPVVFDLKQFDRIPDLFEKVRERFEGVDILINSAGLGHDAPLSSGTTELFAEMLHVNVLALSIATREAVIDMKRRKVDGHIVHISSMSAYRVQGASGMYAATKHAVRALTEGLRLELRACRSGIRVSSISPGDVDTEFLARLYNSERLARDNAPKYEQLTARDVSAAVIHTITAPAGVEIHDILIRPTHQPD